MVAEFPSDPDDEEFVTHVVDADSGDVRDPFPPGVFLPLATDDPNVAIAIFDEDGTIGRFDVARRQPVGPRIDPGFEIRGYWRTDDRLVVLGSSADGPVRLQGFDLQTGSAVAPAAEAEEGWDIVEIVIVDDVMYTIEVGDHWRIQRRDASTGAVVGDPAESYRNVASNGEITIASTINGRIFQADPQTLQPIGSPFPGTTGAASDLELTSDGTLLMVRGDDETLRFYDVATRTPLGDPVDLNKLFRDSGAVLRPDGLHAAAVTNQGIVIWDLNPEHWAQAACRVAGRNLTRAEWDQYLGDLAPYRTTCPAYPSDATN